jgi:DNA primase
MAGVLNVVAPHGTAFTAEQARILKRYVSEVVLCFDSDQAGQNATVRSLDHLLAAELAVRVATVPPPHDPDSFIKTSGGDAFRQLIERAEGFFDYYLHRLCADNEVTSDRGRLAVLRAMAEAVHKTRNGVLIDKYAQKTALRLGVSADAVRSEFRKLARTRPAASEPTQPSEEEPARPGKPPTHEYWLLKLLFGNDELLPWAAIHLDPQWLQHPLTREIVTRRLNAHKDATWRSVAAFLDEFEGAEMKNLITEVTVSERPLPNPEKQLADVALELRKDFMERQKAALTQRLGQPDLSETERIELLIRQQEIRALKTQPFAAVVDDVG